MHLEFLKFPDMPRPLWQAGRKRRHPPVPTQPLLVSVLRASAPREYFPKVYAREP